MPDFISFIWDMFRNVWSTITSKFLIAGIPAISIFSTIIICWFFFRFILAVFKRESNYAVSQSIRGHNRDVKPDVTKVYHNKNSDVTYHYSGKGK